MQEHLRISLESVRLLQTRLGREFELVYLRLLTSGIAVKLTDLLYRRVKDKVVIVTGEPFFSSLEVGSMPAY